MNIPGGWEITKDALNSSACNLPQQVASAFSKVTMELVGAKYEPLLYLATQVVNGTNHMILCKQALSDLDHTDKISVMTIHIPTDGDPQIVSISQLF